MVKQAALSLIRGYQAYLKRAFPPSCRFTPSCSEYAYQAIEKYGLFKGIIIGAKRIVLCHPLSGKSGYYPLE
jgi:putative membrane protein insertion efficiency factor